MSGRKISIRSLKTLEVTVLMGGVSSERKISLVSGEAVYKSLLSQGYKARKFDLQYSNMNHFFSLKTDFVFIALHGMLGEDGFVQSVLEMKGIPYSGSGPLASALSLNKYYAKAVMMQNQIPTPAFKMVSKKGFAKSIISKVKSFPVVVKPVSQGSAIGRYSVKPQRA